MSKIIYRVWSGALVAAALCAAPAYADVVDFSKIPGQKDWNWAKGRITAATVIDCRAVRGVGKYVMFFHGSGPRKEIKGDCYKNCSIGIAWSDDLKEWTWPGKAETRSRQFTE